MWSSKISSARCGHQKSVQQDAFHHSMRVFPEVSNFTRIEASSFSSDVGSSSAAEWEN
jgi:hypothetical protein